jgi:hypothetical protein
MDNAASYSTVAAGAGNKDFRYRVQLKFLQTFFTVYCCLLHDGCQMDGCSRAGCLLIVFEVFSLLCLIASADTSGKSEYY